jgi:hypothetical protein
MRSDLSFVSVIAQTSYKIASAQLLASAGRPAGLRKILNPLLKPRPLTMTAGSTGELAGTPITSNGNGTKPKLHGRAFYESIGSPKTVLAPMVDQSELVCANAN